MNTLTNRGPKLSAENIIDDDNLDEIEPEYHNEVRVCFHGIPKGAGCEWCEDESANQD